MISGVSFTISNLRRILSATIFFLVLTSPSTILVAFGACSSYNPSTRTISITCNTTLSNVYDEINDSNILAKEPDGAFILKAIIVVTTGDNLRITAADTHWLKITNTGTSPNYIRVYGSISIDGIKITSWDTSTSGVLEQNSSGSVKRGALQVLSGATMIEITNSELAYLGYSSSNGFQGLHFGGGGANSLISGNDIHHLWYGIYTKNVGGIVIDSNHVHDNHRYGIDPHTGTHDMMITNNLAHNNGAQGIICAANCYNVMIENNTVYKNVGAGIMLSRNTHDSVVRNNIAHDENTGISIYDSDKNEVYGNQVSNSTNGIAIRSGSTGNTVHGNSISGGSNGLNVVSSSTRNNVFDNNSLAGMTYGVRIDAGIDNTFTNTTIGSVGTYEYYVGGGLSIASQLFSNDRVRGTSGTNTVNISGAGIITVNGISYNTDSSPYTSTLSYQTITVNSP